MNGGVEMKTPKDMCDDQELLRLFVKVWVKLGLVNYQITWYAEYYWSDPDEQ